MASDETKVLETSEKPKTSPGYRFGGAGPGRPKGRANNLTLQQRAVAEMVLGKPGTPEFDEFVQSQRKQALAGILPPAILQTWLYYLTGKPKETIEVEGTVTVEKIVREVINVTPEPLQLDAVH